MTTCVFKVNFHQLLWLFYFCFSIVIVFEIANGVTSTIANTENATIAQDYFVQYKYRAGWAQLQARNSVSSGLY